MDRNRFSLVAIGCSQALTVGVAGSVSAQNAFQDQDCQIDTPFTCADVSCQTPTNPDRTCRHEQGLGIIGGQQVDGCFCFDPGQALPSCMELMDDTQSPVCVDLNCGETNPGFHCDPITCECMPDTVPTQTLTATPVGTPVPTPTVTATATPMQVFDHLKCYKIKDPTKIKGLVDMDSPQFGLEQGCKISKAKKFCVPVMKTIDTANTIVNKQPVNLMPIVGQNLVDDYICYKIKCKNQPVPPDTAVEDQFDSRTLTRFKASELCVPARKVP